MQDVAWNPVFLTCASVGFPHWYCPDVAIPDQPPAISWLLSRGGNRAVAGALAEAAGIDAEAHPVRLGVIGIGNRGTALLRSVLELPGTPIVAVCDADRKHRSRGEGIIEKARGQRPESYDDPRKVFDRNDVDAVIVALPCDAHLPVYSDALAAGKHLYAEKPLGITLDGCDRLMAASAAAPSLAVHVGFQRRSNPRFRQGIELIGRGELGPLIEVRATWTSSNGPITGHGGWLGSRERSGDWMVEQGVHIWDVFHWLAGELAVEGDGLGPPRPLRFDRPESRRDGPLLRRARMARRFSRFVRAELDRPVRRELSPARRCACWESEGASTSPPALSPSATGKSPAARFTPALSPTRGWLLNRSSHRSDRRRRCRRPSRWPTPARPRASAFWFAKPSTSAGRSR